MDYSKSLLGIYGGLLGEKRIGEREKGCMAKRGIVVKYKYGGWSYLETLQALREPHRATPD
jgi:hypothetical protein